jgi:hypothetical protein
MWHTDVPPDIEGQFKTRNQNPLIQFAGSVSQSVFAWGTSEEKCNESSINHTSVGVETAILFDIIEEVRGVILVEALRAIWAGDAGQLDSTHPAWLLRKDWNRQHETTKKNKTNHMNAFSPKRQNPHFCRKTTDSTLDIITAGYF